MKIRSIALIFILVSLFLILCTACDSSLTDTHDTSENSTADETTIIERDPFEAIRNSKEIWLSHGLSAYESKKPIQNFKEFFSEYSNLSYLTLYNHLFTYDSEKSIPIAEALFDFIYREYGVDALLNIEKRTEYKNAYLASLGLDNYLASSGYDNLYVQLPAVEEFFVKINFSSDSTYKYIFSIDNITYHIKDIGAGMLSQYHSILYHSTKGLNDFTKYLNDNNLDQWINTDRHLNYFLVFDNTGINITHNSGNIYINDYSSILHEAVHAMGIGSKDNIWLSEGLCSYFNEILAFNPLVIDKHISTLNMAAQGKLDSYIEQGELTAVMWKYAYEKYTEIKGPISLDTFDTKLYTNLCVKAQFEHGINISLAQAYEAGNKKEIDSVGGDLSYQQATSLVTYLVDTYGIEAVLQAYHTQDIESNLGKSYEDLKQDWITYLG